VVQSTFLSDIDSNYENPNSRNGRTEYIAIEKTFIWSFIKEIEIVCDKTTISYTLSIIDILRKSEEILFLSAVQYGGRKCT
jgi:hypothetical protein